MALKTGFKPLALDELRREAAVMKADGWRFMQTHAVNTDDGIDLYYSFMKDGEVVNLRVEGVTKDQPVPSITDLFLAAFVFENEARELFGVDMRDIAIDFHGGLYGPAENAPMTFISPEQKAAKEKALKVAQAKAAKAAAAEGGKDATAPAAAAGKRVFVMTPELQARLDAKLPTLSDEKKAKVEAALKARKEEAEAAAVGAPAPAAAAPAANGADKASPAPATAQPEAEAAKPVDAVLEQKLASLDPDKAAKVRAALAGKTGGDASSPAASEKASQAESPADQMADEQLAQLIAHMDDTKAAVVRAALNAKGGE